jgi:tetratricopeptide (TPR) repeat protein
LRRIVAAAALAAAGWLGGCAAWLPLPQTRALLAQKPSGLPERAELDTVPFFPQTPFHCGPAALATVLTDAGLPTQPATLADAVFLPAREGALQTEMLAGARRHGAVAYPLPGRLDALLREVAAGHPVVVLQNLGLDSLPRWHYAVLVGYDLARRELVLRSGTTQRETMPLASFEYTWARAGHWAFVARPPGRLPASVDEDAAVQAAIGFERVAPSASAARAYAALLDRWPSNLLAGLGLGNTKLAAGELEFAATAFTEVAQRHDSAVAWNNLAQTQSRRGLHEAAIAAAQRAVARAKAAEPQWAEATSATLREVQAAARP